MLSKDKLPEKSRCPSTQALALSETPPMTVSFWLNQPVADDGSLKSNRTLDVGVIVVVGAIVVGATVVVMVVAGIVVAVMVVAVTVVVVVVASDAHALRSEMADVVSNNFARNAMTEFYH